MLGHNIDVKFAAKHQIAAVMVAIFNKWPSRVGPRKVQSLCCSIVFKVKILMLGLVSRIKQLLSNLVTNKQMQMKHSTQH